MDSTRIASVSFAWTAKVDYASATRILGEKWALNFMHIKNEGLDSYDVQVKLITALA